MLNKMTLQRSLMLVLGLLLLGGMLSVALVLNYLQQQSRNDREAYLAALFADITRTNNQSLSGVGTTVGRIIVDELVKIQDQQYRDNLEHQHDRARQLAQLMASFVAHPLAAEDDALIDDVCRSAAFDSDIGVLLVEDNDGNYYGGYYREDHPGLRRRFADSAVPFGADRVARALRTSHSDSVFEADAPIFDPSDVTRRIGQARLFILNDRLAQEAENLARRGEILADRTVNSVSVEAQRLRNDQRALMAQALESFSRSGRQADLRLSIWTIIVIVSVVSCCLVAVSLVTLRLLRPLEEASKFAARLGAGDLDHRLAPPAQRDARQLTLALNAMADALRARGEETRNAIAELRSVLARVGLAAARLDSGARDIAESSQGFANGLSDLRAALSQIASALNEMERHSEDNAQNAVRVTKMSNEAHALAKQGEEDMQAMLESTNIVTDVYGRLAGMVKTIDSIAFQTNLLALNASVEAAHAGRYGKGFTVVADEVRRLAASTSQAAAEAKREMDVADVQVAEAQNRARVTAEALSGIAASTREVSQSLDVVADASNEQLSGVQSANISMERIGTVAESGLDEAKHIAATTAMLSDMARQLNAILEHSTHGAPAGKRTTPNRRPPEPPGQGEETHHPA